MLPAGGVRRNTIPSTAHSRTHSLLPPKAPALTKPVLQELKQNAESHEAALEAEGALLGIISPRRVIERHLHHPGYHQSPAPIKHMWAVQLLGMEVQNGGIHQYFFNSSGDLWPDALQGLEEMG